MNALNKVYELQQKELAAKSAAEKAANAKHQREVAAFQNSGLPEIFRQFADIPLRTEIRQRIYLSDFKALAYSSPHPGNNPRMKDVTLRCLYGNNGPRWWCVESPDTQRIKYAYSSGRAGSGTNCFDAPSGEWLDAFIEYAAKACDPAAVADALQQPREPAEPQALQRRKLIPT